MSEEQTTQVTEPVETTQESTAPVAPTIATTNTYYKDSMEGSAQQAQIDVETSQAQSEAELRKEWGRSFDENIKKAGAVAKANMDGEILELTLADGRRLGDHPAIIKGFANIANLMSEDKMIGTGEVVQQVFTLRSMITE